VQRREINELMTRMQLLDAIFSREDDDEDSADVVAREDEDVDEDAPLFLRDGPDAPVENPFINTGGSPDGATAQLFLREGTDLSVEEEF
jgi:hypothetical protein